MKHIKNIHTKLALHMRERAWGVLTAALLTLCGTDGVAQTVAAPAPDAVCTVGTQNRYAPLDLVSGNYQITNLPGNGLAPFGTNGSAQPFRVRATCSDGTVGETALAFPTFEQRVVNSGDIVWGQRTMTPSALQMTLPGSTIYGESSIQAQVVATYPNGGSKNVTARATGTGYRSSAAGFIGVSGEGLVFGQPSMTVSSFSTLIPVPPQVVITSENDGVTVSRLVTLGSNRKIEGSVRAADGSSAGAGVTVLLRSDMAEPGQEPLKAVTDAAGHYVFSPLPLGYFCFEMLAYKASPLRLGHTQRSCLSTDEQRTVNISFLASATVNIRTVDAANAPLSGVRVGYSPELARLWPADLARPSATTDALGNAVFDDVPVGRVTATSAAAVISAMPGNDIVTAGKTSTFILKLRDGSAIARPTLTGTVSQAPAGSAVTGALVVLREVYGEGAMWTQLASAGGQYRFDDLAPGGYYELSVRLAGQVLWRQHFTAISTAGIQTINVALPQRRTIGGVVYEPDGVSRSAGATVTLSQFEFGSWAFDRSVKADANGRYVLIGLSDREYRLDVQSVDGLIASASVDLRSNAELNVIQDIELVADGGSSITTAVDLGITYLGTHVLKAADGVTVAVFNDGCQDGCAVSPGTVAGHWIVDMQLIPGANSLVVTWRGQKQTIEITVDESTNGQTLLRSANFSPRMTGELSFLGQRSWYSFEAQAGDRIDVTPVGVASTAQRTAAYAVRVDLYKGADGATQALRSGHGFDPKRVAAWATGDIRGFVATETGTYTVVASPYYGDAPAYLGDYGLDIAVNDVAVDVTTWSATGKRAGGAVNGRVLRANGSAAVQQQLQITAGGEMVRMVERIRTDAAGDYHYDNLPVGQLGVSAIQAGLTLASASASVGEGETVTLNLRLPQVAGRVMNASGRPVSGANVTLAGPNGSQLQTYANALGEFIFATAQVGPGQSVKVHHAGTGLSKEATVDVLAGPVTVVPDFVYGGIHGRLLYGSGLPAQNVSVEAQSAGGGAYAVTDEQGVYYLEGLTPTLGITLMARHPRNEAVQTNAVADLLDGQETTVADMRFALMSRIEGWVRDEKGRGLDGAKILVGLPGAAHACGDSWNDLAQQVTDSEGHYVIDELPAGQAMSISAGFGFLCQEQSLEIGPLAQGESRALPDFVYPGGGETGSVTLRLVDTAGQLFVPPEGIQVHYETECGNLFFTVSNQDGTQVKDYLERDSRYTGVMPGSYRAQARLSWWCQTLTFDSALTAVVAREDVTLGVALPMVRGRIKDHQGQPVAYPSVSLVVVSPDGKQSETHFAKTNEQGDYLILAPAFLTGNYVLRVEAGWRGNDLEVPVSITGELATSRPALTLDVTLPPTTAVTGRVRTASGAIPASGIVYVKVEGIDQQFLTMPDLSGGSFSIRGLPLGQHFVQVLGVDPAFTSQSVSLSSTAKGYSFVELPVTVASAVQSLDLGESRMAGFGTVEVTARDAFGTVLPNHSVYLSQSRFGAPALGYILTYGKTTGTNGKASFIVPATNYVVAARASGPVQAVNGGMTDTTVLPGQSSSVTLDVKDGIFLGGDSAYLAASGRLSATDGTYYVPNLDARLLSGTTSSGYRYGVGPALAVDGILTPQTYGVRLLNNSREWMYGPFSKGSSLVVKRRIYIPEAGGFARVIDTVRNTGNAAVEVRLSQTAPPRSGYAVVELSSQESGNTAVIYGLGTGGDEAANEWVGLAYADGVSTLKPTTTLLNAPNDNGWDGSVLLNWRSQLGAGQTMSVAHFHLLGDADASSVRAKIQKIVSKTMPGMFDGLTATEKSEVRNFNIAQ